MAKYLMASLLCLLFVSPLPAQTTGKIAGKVTDAQSGESLTGANILLEGTSRGATADLNGDFFIINLEPGTYTVRISMVGYETLRLQNVRVSVNRTFEVTAKLKATVLSGQEVTVIADRVAVKKDQTSSVRNVSSSQMEILPTESVSAVVAMQPGVVLGHFRGGRSDEVTYLIDGMQVDESYGRGGCTVDVEKDVVEDLEVITGIFSAKYGNAMSGVVNAVTKDGGRRYHGSASIGFGNYLTPHKDIFIGLEDSDFARRKDFQFALNGPILGDRLTFASNLRYQNNKGHLNGIRRFEPDNYSDYTSADSTQWYSEHTGDNAYVAMNTAKNLNVWGKLTMRPTAKIKTSLQYILNDDEGQGYSHSMKYNPDGRGTGYHTSHLASFQLNHMLSERAFYELKGSYVSDYNASYLFKNPYDKRYIHDLYSRSEGPGFSTGGQSKGHSERTLQDYTAKGDFVWQLHPQHSLEGGAQYSAKILENESYTIRNRYYGTAYENLWEIDPATGRRRYLFYEPMIMPDSTLWHQYYKVKPVELSAYLQDKMEFAEMVINLGVRLDYFDPKITYPSQWRNPSNQLSFPDNPERMSHPVTADPKYQISPRLGISYQLGKTALLRFGYGHFMQMPPLYAMYDNFARLVPADDYSTTMGNPQVRAQRTIQYEVGLWQELIPNMSLEVALFYRDIYDLLSARVLTTYNQIRYGLYSNKDYANARGLELKYEYITGRLSVVANYTLQFSRGNADTPTSTFSRAGAKQDPVNKMIPMSWDQRHTANMTIGYAMPRYGATMTVYYNSGSPFTWSPLSDSPLSRVNLYPNNEHIPSSISVDLSGHADLLRFAGIKLRATLLVYNLLDALNDSWVNSTTGRAYTAIIRATDRASHHSDFNTYEDRIHDPTMYSTPRLVKLGLEMVF
ncbi:MAG TPA: TonB-dependent receptor [bacterium]|nr:TonB-dependent receptor [bacterium]HQI47736.1 TonB-dependent receptor [bacterium]HQJ64097.1 TonB-dependent receptor [bacterium]